MNLTLEADSKITADNVIGGIFTGLAQVDSWRGADGFKVHKVGYFRLDVFGARPAWLRRHP